ncbi:hypothetical protein ACFQ9X_29795 [Catenulispora yoronensis]
MLLAALNDSQSLAEVVRARASPSGVRSGPTRSTARSSWRC